MIHDWMILNVFFFLTDSQKRSISEEMIHSLLCVVSESRLFVRSRLSLHLSQAGMEKLR